MHPQSSQGGADAPSRRRPPDPKQEFAAEQRYLLELLLDESDHVLIYREALTALVEEPENAIREEAFGNALRALISHGLVTRQGELLILSRAARAMVDLGWHFA